MLIDVEFASWEDAKKYINSSEKTVLFNSQNYDHILIYGSRCYPTISSTLLLLDSCIGGDWLDLEDASNYLVEIDNHYAVKTGN